MSVIKVSEVDASDWTCACSGSRLEMKPVELEYLGSQFNVELPMCPVCGMVLIPENLALGKMHQVEKLLEDK